VLPSSEWWSLQTVASLSWSCNDPHSTPPPPIPLSSPNSHLLFPIFVLVSMFKVSYFQKKKFFFHISSFLSFFLLLLLLLLSFLCSWIVAPTSKISLKDLGHCTSLDLISEISRTLRLLRGPLPGSFPFRKTQVPQTWLPRCLKMTS